MSFFDYPIYQIPEPEEIRPIVVHSRVMVLVTSTDYEESEKILLHKILKSVNQDPEEAEILQVDEGDHVSIRSQETDCPLIICFGVRPSQCCLQIEDSFYELFKINNKTYLFSSSLCNLPDLPDERRALWSSLKEYFKLS